MSVGDPFTVSHTAWALFGVMVLLQLGDVWTTHRFLTRGTGRERNRLMAGLFAQIGFWPAMALKMLVCTGASLGLAGMGWAALVPFIAIYAVVVVNNFRIG